MENIKRIILEAPDAQIADSVKPIAAKWPDDTPPAAIQLLELIDHCVRCGGASEFSINWLDLELQYALKMEGKTFEEILPEATWRNEPI